MNKDAPRVNTRAIVELIASAVFAVATTLSVREITTTDSSGAWFALFLSVGALLCSLALAVYHLRQPNDGGGGE